MSVLLEVNGQEFDYPEVGDVSWGPDATDWAVAVTSGMLQKAGGLFLLLADVDFGGSFGLKSIYYTSRTANAATAGAVRLARANVISWRNEANDGNLDLSVNASNELLFNGLPIDLIASVTDTATINLTLTGTALSADIINASITNAMVAVGAAIAVNKLAALTASRVLVSDGSGFASASAVTSTTLGYLDATSSIQTQLDAKQASGNYITALTGDVTASGPGSVASTITPGIIVNAMVNAAAAIAYSKLNLSASILNADIAAAAAIAVNKLAALTASRAVVSDGSGFLAAATTTATEIGYVNGVTSAIQTQINTKAPSASPTFSGTITTPLTASRALVTGASSELAVSATTAAELAYVNGVTSAIQTQLDARVFKSTYTAKGSILAATAASTPANLTVGADNLFLKADSSQTTGLIWAAPSSAGVSVVSKTSAYTATTADDVILCDATSAAFQIDLYTAVGNSGKQLTLKKIDSSVNAITIDPNLSQTIDGGATTTINTLNEALVIVSDGTNWQVLDRRIPSIWTSFTPTGTWLTGGGNTTWTGQWRREGDSLRVQGGLSVTGAPTSASLTTTLPNSWIIDAAKINETFSTDTIGSTLGTAGARDVSANLTMLGVTIYASSTTVGILYYDIVTAKADATSFTQALPFTWATGDGLSFDYFVPITGWNG